MVVNQFEVKEIKEKVKIKMDYIYDVLKWSLDNLEREERRILDNVEKISAQLKKTLETDQVRLDQISQYKLQLKSAALQLGFDLETVLTEEI